MNRILKLGKRKKYDKISQIKVLVSYELKGYPNSMNTALTFALKCNKFR